MAAMLEQVASDAERLVLRATFPGTTPADLFAAWTDPARLCRWWPTQAATDPRVGGAYRLEWPQQGWTLRGTYTAFEPEHHLAFTWRWDHDPAGDPTTTVDLRIAPLADGATQLTLTHGPYTSSAADQEQRASHLAGWRHFLPRLQALLAAPSV